MTAPTLEERVSRLEGACDHLATKADVEGLCADLLADIERLRADFARRLRWLGIAVISSMGVITGIVLAVVKLT